MSNHIIPKGIQAELYRMGVPQEHHVTVVNMMAEAGDWYAIHWKSCGLLEGGPLAKLMCRRAHKIEPGVTELSRSDVKGMAEPYIPLVECTKCGSSVKKGTTATFSPAEGDPVFGLCEPCAIELSEAPHSHG